MMFRILRPAALVIALGSGAPAEDAELARLAFAAEADAQAPREATGLRLVCRKTVDKTVVSFVSDEAAGAADGVLLATFTVRPLADPARDIWLHWRLLTEASKRRKTGTMDWGYVYDQDGDARPDRLVFLYGPMPVLPDNPPPNLPNMAGGRVTITGVEQLEFVMHNMRFVFWQAADSDGDEAADTLALPAVRSADGWYKGWMIVSGFGAEGGGSCNYFEEARADGAPCAATGERFSYADGGRAVTAQLPAAAPSRLFDLMVRAAAECRLRPGQLRKLGSARDQSTQPRPMSR